MARPYVKMTPEKMARLREWYIARMKLGTQKTIAKELGISPARVEQLCVRIREELIDVPN